MRLRHSIIGMIAMLLMASTTTFAYHLDGIWRNDQQNITLRIEQDQDGIRTKRTDQPLWHRYKQKNKKVFTDRRGNRYQVVKEDRIVWRAAKGGKKIVYRRVDSRNYENGRYRNRHDAWDQKNERSPQRSNDRDIHDERSIQGSWLDRATRERIMIETIPTGLRIRTDEGPWENYATDRRNDVYKSKTGKRIELIDPGTLKWTDRRGQHEKILIRYKEDRRDKSKKPRQPRGRKKGNG